MSKTAVIIQAHMGSTRLPGKVLMDLCGRTALSHVIERCRAIENADTVCCAVPESSENDVVAAEAERAGAVVFRGSESDVLERYYLAAKQLNADVVLRVTADCPLLDPAVSAAVLKLREAENVTVLEQESMRIFLFQLNNQRSPTSDVNVRRAISYAFDYDAFIDNIHPFFHRLPIFIESFFNTNA